MRIKYSEDHLLQQRQKYALRKDIQDLKIKLDDFQQAFLNKTEIKFDDVDGGKA